MNTSIYDISSKSFHNLYAMLFGFVFWFIILTVIAVTMVTKLQFPEGAVYGPVRRERVTFGHVSAHGSLVTFTHV